MSDFQDKEKMVNDMIEKHCECSMCEEARTTSFLKGTTFREERDKLEDDLKDDPDFQEFKKFMDGLLFGKSKPTNEEIHSVTDKQLKQAGMSDEEIANFIKFFLEDRQNAPYPIVKEETEMVLTLASGHELKMGYELRWPENEISPGEDSEKEFKDALRELVDEFSAMLSEDSQDDSEDEEEG